MEPKSHAANPITQFALDTGYKFDGFHEGTIWTTRVLVGDRRNESDVPFSGSVGDQRRGDITHACRMGANELPKNVIQRPTEDGSGAGDLLF